MKTVKVPYASIKFDDNFYPRQSYDNAHINRIAVAINAGNEMPPIVLDKKTNLCVDGLHRSRGYLKVDGEGALVPAIFKTFPNRKAMILESARLNATHGKALNTCDRVHFYTIAKRHNISMEDIVGALQVPQADFESLIKERLAFSPGKKKSGAAPDLPLKSTIKHMAGKTLTKEQAEVNQKLGGMRQLFFVNQVLMLVKTKMIDREDEAVMAALGELRDQLDSFL